MNTAVISVGSNINPHFNIKIAECGHVGEFYDEEIEKRQVKIAKDRGFVIHEHSLSLYVDCVKPTCVHRKV